MDDDKNNLPNGGQPENPFAEWFGIAPLPEGQTVNGIIREMRDEEPGPDPAREGGPGALIVYLRPGEPIPRDEIHRSRLLRLLNRSDGEI